MFGPEKTFTCSNGIPSIAHRENLLYKCYADKTVVDRLWMVADVPNAADHIYVGFEKDTHSQGFGGARLVFNLSDQSRCISLQGPWHGNADALYTSTGIDVRNTHYVQLVVGKSFVTPRKSPDVIQDIVYYDDPHLDRYYYFDDVLYSLMERNPDLDSLVYYHAGSGGATIATYLRSRDYSDERSRRCRS